MANGNDRLVWIDLEMTGLDPSYDEICEIACIVSIRNPAPGRRLNRNQS